MIVSTVNGGEGFGSLACCELDALNKPLAVIASVLRLHRTFWNPCSSLVLFAGIG